MWLDEGAEPTRRMRRLQRRGMEIRWADPSLRSYKKFWPYLVTERVDAPLVIADDDVIYPDSWLEGLLAAHSAHPSDVIAYRAHRIVLDDRGEFRAYSDWVSCDADSASYSHFATGVSGVLYPRDAQRALIEAGDAFRTYAPTADDVWLHRTTVLAGIRTRQALPGQRHWPFIPGSQATGLNAVNVVGGANDTQLSASHTTLTRWRIRKDITAGSVVPPV